MRSLSFVAVSLAVATLVAPMAGCAAATVGPVVAQAVPSGSGASPQAPPAALPAASVASVAAPPPQTAATSSSPPPPGPLPPPPPAFQQALDAARKATAASEFPAADKHLVAAESLVGDDAHLAYLVAHVRATRFVYAGDFEHAAAAFVAVIPTLAKRPELPDEFWSHNAMMMIREGQGDPAAALAENDQATLCAARGTWDPQGRDALAFQKDRWHRAYLTRMLAESRAGSAKE